MKNLYSWKSGSAAVGETHFVWNCIFENLLLITGHEATTCEADETHERRGRTIPKMETGQGEGSVTAQGQGKDHLLDAGQGEGSVTAHGQGKDHLLAACQGEGSVTAHGQGKDHLLAACQGEASVTAQGQGKDHLLAACEGEGSVTAQGQGKDHLLAACEGEGSDVVHEQGKSLSAQLRFHECLDPFKTLQRCFLHQYLIPV